MYNHTDTIRFTGHVEGPAPELAEVFEEDGYESGNVLRSLFGGTLENK